MGCCLVCCCCVCVERDGELRRGEEERCDYVDDLLRYAECELAFGSTPEIRRDVQLFVIPLHLFIVLLATFQLLLHRGVNFSVMSARNLGQCNTSDWFIPSSLLGEIQAFCAATMRRVIVPH